MSGTVDRARLWRFHPVLFAGLLGAVTGCATTLATELEGVLNGNSRAVLPILLPTSMLRFAVNENRVLQTAILLLIEVAANVVVYALLFSIPVALVMGLRRFLFRWKRRPD